jgi:hypothetical protein
MNLQSKQSFAEMAFNIYQNGDDLEVIAIQIEALMVLFNITYSSANLVSTLNNEIVKTAHDRFVDALDAREVRHAQHMKVLLDSHCNFLHASWITINQAA